MALAKSGALAEIMREAGLVPYVEVQTVENDAAVCGP